MARASLAAMGCLWLGGCVNNTVATQNTQLEANGLASRPPPRRVTPTAALASARLIIVHRTTSAGATLLLASPQALDPSCAPLGDIVVKVTSAPDHGTVHVAAGSAYSNFQPGDPPFMCNARKSPATLITYQAAAGYTGPDVAVVRIFFPDGHAPTIRYDITVD